MHIVTLTEKRYNEFSKKHENRNYKQSVEYANFMSTQNYKKLYIGLEDEKNNVIAATLILEKKEKGKYYSGYVPNGFLIDYNDKALLEIFTNKLKEYLYKLNYIYINIEPNIPYKILDKNNKLINYNYNILNTIKDLGYLKKEESSKFEAILNIKDNINDIYNKFDRTIKRKMKENNLIGITFFEENNIENFYNLIKRKKTKNIEYYNNLAKSFNDENNKFKIFFAKINPEIYLNNYRYLLKKEQEKNYILQEIITNPNKKKTIKLINNKLISDKLLYKYQNKVIEASQIFSNYPDGIIIAGCAIIKTDNTIYFIEEGYNNKLRNIYSLPTLKWEIIKKYNNLGYNNFNLGKIPTLKSNDKIYGITQSKISFNPNIYEYPGSFDLIINKYVYTIINKNLQTLLPNIKLQNMNFKLKNTIIKK